MNSLDTIGENGPIITLVIGIIYLLKQPVYLSSYLVFAVINRIINSILKDYIREPRPNKSDEDTGSDKYGMPSLHAQSVFFNTAYLYLVKGSPMVLIAELFISFFTLYQRWKYKRHTISQLFMGSLVGVIIAYISVTLTEKYLTI